jgi:serpin B
MLTNGAEKKTLKELCDVLGNDIEKINKKVIDFLNLKFKSIEIANMIATKNEILNDFESIVKKYKSKITNDLNLNYINHWCSEHTNGKIKKILDELSPGTIMILLNAIYFNNKWEKEFPKDKTEEDIFYGCKNESLVYMMNIEDKFKYVETEKEQIIELGYKNDNMSALIFLPKNEIDINTYIDDLNDEKIIELIDKVEYVGVNLKFPKFKFEGKIIFNDILKKMGIKKGFEKNAEFCKISDGNMEIEKVLQKTYLEIDEVKTEAAATTEITMKLRGARRRMIEMNVNHPFLFFIRCNKGLEKNEQLIFMGKFEDLN